MPAPRRYPDAAAELVRSGRIARARSVPFATWWADWVLRSPVVTFHNAEPDTPFPRWAKTTSDRHEQRAVIEPLREAWRRAYERWPVSKNERALARLGDVAEFVPPLPLRTRTLDVLADAPAPLTAQALARRVGATVSSVLTVTGPLVADLLVSTPPRRPRDPRRFEAVPPGTPGDTPEQIREALYGEPVEIVTVSVMVMRALEDGPMTVVDLQRLLAVDSGALRTAVSGMCKGGRLLRSTPGRTGHRHGGQVTVALPEHGDRIRATPTQAVAA